MYVFLCIIDLRVSEYISIYIYITIQTHLHTYVHTYAEFNCVNRMKPKVHDAEAASNAFCSSELYMAKAASSD